MIKAGLGLRTLKSPTTAKAKQPAWKVRVNVVDLTQRKLVASIVGYGDTLDVIDKMRKECAWAVRNGGRYGCSDTQISFLRYGAPHQGETTITFFEEPLDVTDPVPEQDPPQQFDNFSDDDMWEDYS